MNQFLLIGPTQGVVALRIALVVVLVGVGIAYAQEGTPIPTATDEHKLLQKDVGAWDAEMSLFIEPGAAPMVSQGTEKNELLPGGLWLISRFEGSIAGMPFSGVGTSGYDPVEKQYVGTWVDSTTPHIQMMRGDYDAETETLTGVGEGRDPETGEIVKYRVVSKYIDDDTRTFEMHAPNEDGEYWKMMEIRYKRRAE